MPEGRENQHGPAISAQLDLGARLTEMLGLHVILLFDRSKWMEVRDLVDRYDAGAVGFGLGGDVRLRSFLASVAMGFQGTIFTTNNEPESPDSARAGFVLARAGYTVPLGRGVSLGGHLFGKYAWSRYDELNNTRYDPKAYTLGGLLSVGFDGARPLVRARGASRVR
jgi:hypothetical protein